MNEYSHIKIIIMKDLKLHVTRQSSTDSNIDDVTSSTQTLDVLAVRESHKGELPSQKV